ncbi:MAG: hypothetical protein WD834_03700, partial [Actinomycetota bacterium]
ALILLGLLAAGVVVDFAVENDLAGAPERTFSLFGGSFTFNETQVVLGAAVLGALAVLFLVLGGGMSRGSLGRRRALKHRVSDLERENTDLRSRPADVTTTDTRTGDVVRVEGETVEKHRETIAEREAAEREAAEREHAQQP